MKDPRAKKASLENAIKHHFVEQYPDDAIDPNVGVSLRPSKPTEFVVSVPFRESVLEASMAPRNSADEVQETQRVIADLLEQARRVAEGSPA